MRASLSVSTSVRFMSPMPLTLFSAFNGLTFHMSSGNTGRKAHLDDDAATRRFARKVAQTLEIGFVPAVKSNLPCPSNPPFMLARGHGQMKRPAAGAACCARC